MLLPSTLHLVRSHATPGYSVTYLCRYSDGGGRLFAFVGRVRIPPVCACDVLRARIWQGGYGTCCDCHRDRMSCVSVPSCMISSTELPDVSDRGFSGISENGYGMRVVMPGADTHAMAGS